MKPVTLMAHQKEAVLKLASGKILVGDVGSGKTLTAVAYYVAAQAPRDVYVITTAKKRDSLDWEDEFIKFGVWKTADTTFHGKLKVDSWNNIGKYVDVKDAFFIFDEQRLVGSGAWTKSFYKIAKHNDWLLLSATPGDTWLDYIPVMVANGFYKNKTEFIRRHVVYSPFTKYPKVQRYLESGVLVRRRNQIQVIMPYARHTTRHIHNVTVHDDQDLVREVMKTRWNIFTNEPMRDIADLFRVTRRIVNSDPSRLSFVRDLLQKHPRLIVFYNFDYELEILRTLGTSSTPKISSEDSNVLEFPDSQPRRSISTPNSTGSPTPSKPEMTPSMLSPASSTRPSDRVIATVTSALRRDASETGTTVPTDPVYWNTGPLKSLVNTSGTERPVSQSPSSNSISDGDSKTGSGSGSSTSLEAVESSRRDGPITTLTVAEWNGHKHEPVPTSDRWVYLVQFTAGAEGWNCVSTDAMVFYSLPYSYKLWHQAHGRIDRLNTLYFDLHYYVLESKAWIDLAIRKSLRGKKSFNEASWGRKAA